MTEKALTQTSVTPNQLLSMAVEKGADMGQLEKLMDLQMRWEADQARKAYVSAMAAFKADPPKLHKNKQVSFGTSKGRTEYKHATLDHVSERIGEALARHGLHHRWNVDQSDIIRVTCVIQHEQGHSESVAMSGAPDTSGTKNSIQATGSTVTYLQRYTLLAATGIAVDSGDDDGHGATPTITAEQASELSGMCEQADVAPGLLVNFAFGGNAPDDKRLKDIPASAYVACKNKLQRTIDKRAEASDASA